MLRIITDQTEAKNELRRIGTRTNDGEIRPKEVIVQEIVETVRNQGDRSLLDYTQKFDRQSLTLARLRVSGAELDAAYQQISKDLLNAIQLACQQIEAFHRQRVPKSWVQFADDEIILGKKYTPVDRAGLYIPGGRASYPSTVLMNAIPAKVAQVPRIVMVTPPRRRTEN